MQTLSYINVISSVASFTDSSHRFSEENKKLYVSITEDGGCYTCVTENSEGTAVANFILPPNYSGILELIKLSKVSNTRIAGAVLSE